VHNLLAVLSFPRSVGFEIDTVFQLLNVKYTVHDHTDTGLQIATIPCLSTLCCPRAKEFYETNEIEAVDAPAARGL